MSTEFPSKNGIVRKWHVIDAEDVVLGKLASKAAMLLMGKTQTFVYAVPGYGRSRDRHQRRARSGSRAGKKKTRFIAISPAIPAGWWKPALGGCAQTPPARIVEEAIQGMLPKTKLGKQMYRKLKVYAGDRHPHAAQTARRAGHEITE